MQLLDFLVDAVFLQVCHRQVVLGFYRIRPQADCLLQLVEGFVVAVRDERRAEVGVRLGIVWIEAQGFAKFLGCSLIVSGLDQGHAKVIVGLGETGIQLNGLPELLYHHLRVSARLT